MGVRRIVSKAGHTILIQDTVFGYVYVKIAYLSSYNIDSAKAGKSLVLNLNMSFKYTK